jgi:hypothetical protein
MFPDMFIFLVPLINPPLHLSICLEMDVKESVFLGTSTENDLVCLHAVDMAEALRTGIGRELGLAAALAAAVGLESEAASSVYSTL